MRFSKQIFTVIFVFLIGSFLQLGAIESPNTIQEAFTVVPDSLAEMKEAEIKKEYGFDDNDTLLEVAQKLGIGDDKFGKWKDILGLEAQNQKLDTKKLRQLGIFPYKALLAKQTLEHGFNEINTLYEISPIVQIPLKKLKEMLNLNPNDKSDNHYSLQVLNLEPQQIIKVKEEFEKHKMLFGGNITLVGMMVVFLALIISGLVISLLAHINPDKDKDKNLPKVKIDASGKVKTSSLPLSDDLIVAAITALHLHVHAIEERKRILLTFKRAPINLWHASNIVNMPNQDFMRKRN